VPSAPPLYDVFVSHSSEDKDGFVKPLVARLQDEHVDVWYDAFTLHPGQSLRRSIDQGLARSRFAVVVLSRDFFRKEWPQRELDGLVARETIGEERVIIPIWHNVTAKEVVAVSPTLAGVVAIQSSVGLDHVVHEIMRVVRPQGSPLVYARDMLYRYGLAPPVITDPWWLDIMEASFRPGTAAEHGSSVLGVMDLWQFPIPKGTEDATSRGERIAWTAMQESWRHHAYDQRICQITPPAIVHEFLESEPGLLEMCLRQPLYAARFAPQLTIPGVGGALEPVFDALLDQYQYSAEERRDPWWREARPNVPVPFCPPFIAFREHGFGENPPEDLAEMYFTDDISVVTATTALFPQVAYVAWLCSEASVRRQLPLCTALTQ